MGQFDAQHAPSRSSNGGEWRLAPAVPATTLRSVLELEIFRRADAFVAAGSKDLDRPVRWVHASEISDIAKFLTGGELLLTAGTGIGHSAARQRDFMESLANVGVAALAVELSGRIMDTFAPALLAAADEFGVPLLGLRHEIPFVEASAQVSQLLTAAAVQEAERTVEAVRELTARLAAGADHVELVRTLAKKLARTIALESADHDLQASFSEGAPDDPLLEDWVAHARSSAAHQATAFEPPECLRRPVVVQGTTWGFLHMPWDSRATHVDEVIVESGASAIAISLLNDRVTGARSRHQQGLLINRLLMGDINGEAFVERALRLGRDLRRSNLATVIVGATRESDHAELERLVAQGLREAGVTGVTADIGDGVMSVLAVSGERALHAAVRAVTGEDRHVGVSKLVKATDLPASLQQARAAYLARQPVQHFDQLGLLRLLVPLSNGPELAAFVEDELGAVITYDRTHNSQLYQTLLAFLRADGNKTTAAHALFVQRRTLYYRLERLNKVLGLDVEKVETRLRLQVAVQAAEVLKNNRSASSNHRAPYLEMP